MEDLTQKRVIDGAVYYVTPLMTTKGLETMTLLARLLGPALGAALANVPRGKGLDGLLDMEVADIGSALADLAERIQPTDLAILAETFGTCSEVEPIGGRRMSLDTKAREVYFRGKYGELFGWLKFCLEVNYGDFLGRLKSAASATGRGGRPAAE